MVYPIEKILKIVALFSRFPRSPSRMPKILFFAMCIEEVFRNVIWDSPNAWNCPTYFGDIFLKVYFEFWEMVVFSKILPRLFKQREKKG